MRLIHTADWHLGRLFHNQHLTRDQEHVLEQLVALAAEAQPAAVIVAGDLYDRAVPPTEAVDLLDHVLTELVDRLGIPVVAIAGNHDSGVRVGFAARLLRERGVHLVGELERAGGLARAGELPQAASPIVLHDEHGPVRISALPFADPAEARHAYDDETIHDQAAVCTAGVARALAAAQPGERHVLVAHTFVAGGLESESERPLSVGGAQQVPVPVFDGFDYVALGHLHRPQTCGSEAIRYAGSLLKYSFAEHAHDKSVCVVDIGAPGSAAAEGDDGESGGGADGGGAGSGRDGRSAGARAGAVAVTVETVPLSPRRDVRRVEGTLAELLEWGARDECRDDYVLAALLDKGALLDPIGQLRDVYPNVLAIERPLYETAGAEERHRPRPGSTGDLELFGAFFRYATGDDLTDDQRSELARVIDGLERKRRESTS